MLVKIKKEKKSFVTLLFVKLVNLTNLTCINFAYVTPVRAGETEKK